MDENRNRCTKPGAVMNRRTLWRAATIGVLALVLAACTSAQPYSVAPSKAMVHALKAERSDSAGSEDAAPDDAPIAVAICYNNLINSDAQVWAEAQLACPAGRLTARDDDVLWTRCSVFQPQRANFICVPEAPPAPVQ